LGGSPLCMPLHVKQTYDEEIQKLEQVGCWSVVILGVLWVPSSRHFGPAFWLFFAVVLLNYFIFLCWSILEQCVYRCNIRLLSGGLRRNCTWKFGCGYRVLLIGLHIYHCGSYSTMSLSLINVPGQVHHFGQRSVSFIEVVLFL
jgi:hypothetical protein